MSKQTLTPTARLMLADIGLQPADQADSERQTILVLRNANLSPADKLAAIAELLGVDQDDHGNGNNGTAPQVSGQGFAPTVGASHSRGRGLSISSAADHFAAAGWKGPCMTMSQSSVDDLSRLDRKWAAGRDNLYLSQTGEKIRVDPRTLVVTLSHTIDVDQAIPSGPSMLDKMRADCGLPVR